MNLFGFFFFFADLMASVTASRFVSRSFHFGSSGTNGYEAEAITAQGVTSEATRQLTHSGLRALNLEDKLQRRRTRSRAAAS